MKNPSTKPTNDVDQQVKNCRRYLQTVKNIFQEEIKNPYWPLGNFVTPEDIRTGVESCNTILEAAGLDPVSISEITYGRIK